MDIRTLWITRKGSGALPELVEAWDEHAIDENPEGAMDAFNLAIVSIGPQLDQFRYIVLGIPDDFIVSAFKDQIYRG